MRETCSVFGFDLPKLPEDWTPTRIVVLMECLTPEGLKLKTMSAGASDWVTLGILDAARLQAESRFLESSKP